MEVHHHPQLEHKPKPWLEYVFEYLMIVAAVITGFFAESYREHLSERSREREYVINIQKDLRTDTDNLNVWVPSLIKRMADFDTLITFLKVPGFTKFGSDMYYSARLATRAGGFEAEENTIQELKSSGNLRLIRDRAFENGLYSFEKIVGNYETFHVIEMHEREMISPLIASLFDASVINKMLATQSKAEYADKDLASGSKTHLQRPPGNAQLRSRDKEKINQLIYFLHQRKSSIFGELRLLKEQRKDAEALIRLIDKDYGAKAE